MSATQRDDAASGEVVPAGGLTAEVGPPEVFDAELLPLESTPSAVGAPVAETGYTADGVPTFDYVREKIENRYGTAIGAAELAAETPEGRTVEEQFEIRQQAAAERLAQIRAAMRGDRTDDA